MSGSRTTWLRQGYRRLCLLLLQQSVGFLRDGTTNFSLLTIHQVFVGRATDSDALPNAHMEHMQAASAPTSVTAALIGMLVTPTSISQMLTSGCTCCMPVPLSTIPSCTKHTCLHLLCSLDGYGLYLLGQGCIQRGGAAVQAKCRVLQ